MRGPAGKKTTIDYASDGWWVLTDGLIKYSGRKASGKAAAEVYIPTDSLRIRHFCSLECMRSHDGRV